MRRSAMVKSDWPSFECDTQCPSNHSQSFFSFFFFFPGSPFCRKKMDLSHPVPPYPGKQVLQCSLFYSFTRSGALSVSASCSGRGASAADGISGRWSARPCSEMWTPVSTQTVIWSASLTVSDLLTQIIKKLQVRCAAWRTACLPHVRNRGQRDGLVLWLHVSRKGGYRLFPFFILLWSLAFCGFDCTGIAYSIVNNKVTHGFTEIMSQMGLAAHKGVDEWMDEANVASSLVLF